MPSLAVLALLVAGQVPVDEPTIEQELDALIAKTNALESFHAVYRAKKTGEEGSLELAYEAPDRARVRLSTPQGNLDGWISAKQALFRIRPPGEEERWTRQETPDPSPASLLLDELFPPQDRPLERGLLFIMDAQDSGLQISVGLSMARRRGLLNWLLEMRRSLHDVQRSDDTLTWSRSKSRFTVSRLTGFPERMSFQIEGEERELLVEELHFDEEIDEGLFAWPEGGEDASIDERYPHQFEEWLGPKAIRETGFLRVGTQLASGLRTWDARTRGDWELFLEALHKEQILAAYVESLERFHIRIDKIAAGLREQLKEDHSEEHVAGLHDDCAKARESFVDAIDQTRRGYLEHLPEITTQDGAPRAELCEAEKEVAGRVHDELVRDPILKEFDETIAAVFDE